jgi:hypothetical protein
MEPTRADQSRPEAGRGVSKGIDDGHRLFDLLPLKRLEGRFRVGRLQGVEG